MEFDKVGARRVLNTSEGKRSRMSLEEFRTMNGNLPFYRLPGYSGDFKSDAFGNAVHSYAKALSPGAEFRDGV